MADMIGQGASGVRKDLQGWDLGIPRTRVNPISPLSMLSSSGLMLDSFTGVAGKKLTARERKVVRGYIDQLAGARGLLFTGVSGRNQVTM